MFAPFGPQPINPVKKGRFSFAANRKLRLTVITLGTLAGAVGVACAVSQFISQEVKRNGRERQAVVNVSAPFGSLILGSTNSVGSLAIIEGHGQKGEEPLLKTRYGMRGNTGVLNISIGEDEGKLEAPLAQVERARSGFVLANQRYGDDGAYSYGETRFYSPVKASPAEYSSRVFLTKELPLALSADLGFGESFLDLTGLALYGLNIEAGANQSRVITRAVNPQRLELCSISAGVGEFTMDGIANLNVTRFEFSGGFGMYNLQFNGKLSRNLDASVSVGVGRVSIRIPPEVARVQVYYEDGLLNSYNFSGLARRKDGYATSAGFEHSKAPIVTLRLESGMGTVNVVYR